MAISEIRAMLEKAVDALPDDFRTVFVLRDIEGLSVAETAECLSILPETVKTRLFRARRRLQKSLGEQLSTHLASTFEFGGARCDRIVANVFEQLLIRSVH
jgi:RNA polymerase sigma-70 factor (ECF subfamily)